eukprot:TRINITY_DN755_c2_g1_i2.p1 TRINITY_DN755_c2_g1~~TRINITY_DN755_c2_g1_i2.p1  ORF type:complete len:746 (+),score=173.33 TRINITY_DN755_c2_g1_i2:171-2240(+)
MTEAYVKQGDSAGKDKFIVWAEAVEDGETILALSFLEADGCSEVWEEITEIQKALTLQNAEAIESLASSDFENHNNNSSSLPPVDSEHLSNILELFDIPNPQAKVDLMHRIVEEDFVLHLVSLFARLEKQEENTEAMAQMGLIFRKLVKLNSSAIIEYLVSAEVVETLFKALDCDPTVPAQKRVKHSEWFKNRVVIKEAYPFDTPDIKKIIQQTVYLKYLKDMVFVELVEDMTSCVLQVMITNNNELLVTKLVGNEHWIRNFLTNMKLTVSVAEIRDQLSFLYELSELSAANPLTNVAFHTILATNGFYVVLHKTLGSADPQIRFTSASILLSNVNVNPEKLQKYILETTKNKNSPILKLLVTQILSGEDARGKNILVEVIKCILDVSVEEGLSEQEMDLLNLFYGEYVGIFFEPLTQPVPEGFHEPSEAQLKGTLLEILCLFLDKHAQRIRNFVIQKDLGKSVIQLASAKEKFLVLDSIRFVKKLISLNNQFFTNYVIDSKLLEPVLDAFIANKGHINILDSTVRSIFLSIGDEKCPNKKLLDHFARDLFIKTLPVTHTKIFEDIYNLSLGKPVQKNTTPAVAPPGTPATPVMTRKRTFTEASEDELSSKLADVKETKEKETKKETKKEEVKEVIEKDENVEGSLSFLFGNYGSEEEEEEEKEKKTQPKVVEQKKEVENPPKRRRFTE